MDAAPAPLSSSFGAFSIRRARAVVLVSYSLNAGRCHIGRRLDAAPPRRAVLRLSGFGLLLHEKDGAGDTSNERANAAHGAKEQRGAASSSPHVGAFVHVVRIVHIWGVSCNLLNVWRLSALSIFVHIGGGAVHKPRAGVC